MICYNISLYLYQNTNIIVMAYFRYNILISQYEYWKDQIKSHKFQIIQKFQLPNIAGNFILSIISNVLDVLSIKHFKISEIFGLWYRGVWYRDILILNIIKRHNFFQSFASIGRVDLVEALVSRFQHICFSLLRFTFDYGRSFQFNHAIWFLDPMTMATIDWLDYR